jgi:ribosomal protein S18 acetylase RimI-like enzyme
MKLVTPDVIRMDDLPVVARIHYESLPEDFLPSLGLDFLEAAYYPAAIQSQNAVTYVIRIDDVPAGFVTVAHDSDRFTKDVLKGHYLMIGGYALRAVLRDPSYSVRSAQVFRAALLSKPDPIKGEIVFIAVDKNQRGQGLGVGLVTCAIEYLQHKGVDQCRTKTLASNANVIRMYEKLGWRVRDHFRLMQREYVTLVSENLRSKAAG